MSQEVIKFVESFFQGLKATLVWNGKILTINNIPEDFQNFFGKTQPYKLAFEPNNQEDIEFITKGSILIKAITSYLENKGQTTLIKLNFDRDYNEQFQRYLKMHNCSIYSLSKKIKNKSFYRFTFQTSLQYLNEKEQILNSIYVKNGKVSNFFLDKYNYLEGRKEDLEKQNIKPDYELAKEELKSILQKKIKETSNNLKRRLDKEIERIQEHYNQQLLENKQQLEKTNNQLSNLESQFKKANEQEKQSILAKIDRLKDTLISLNDPKIVENMKKEEEFFRNDEIHKHSLNINNKLINTTIIYYPIFTFTLVFKNPDSTRQIELIFDPLEDTLTPISCEACKREITDISLCLSSHITCQNCLDKCRSCYKPLCANCIKRDCDYCGVRMCKTCVSKCSKCLKSICKNHIKQDFMSGKDCCSSCLLRCVNCNLYTLQTNMKKNQQGNNICKKCFILSNLNKED